jgi:hypothetical protein
MVFVPIYISVLVPEHPHSFATVRDPKGFYFDFKKRRPFKNTQVISPTPTLEKVVGPISTEESGFGPPGFRVPGCEGATGPSQEKYNINGTKALLRVERFFRFISDISCYFFSSKLAIYLYVARDVAVSSLKQLKMARQSPSG